MAGRSPRNIAARRLSLDLMQIQQPTEQSPTYGTTQFLLMENLSPPPDARLQRKRAARACDQCRRRKSRCDGKMDCSSCRTVGLQCSFGYQVKQTRGPVYVAHLEGRIEALEKQLRRTSACDQSLSEDESSPADTTPVNSVSDTVFSPRDASKPSISSLPLAQSFTGAKNEHLNSSPRTFPEQPVHLIDTITTEPRGKAFGIDILRQLGNLSNQISHFPDRSFSSMRLVQALDSSQVSDVWSSSSSSNPFLPPKQITLQLINIAFSEAFHLWPFLDRPQVDSTIYRLYNSNTFGQEPCDRDSLALVYALLALGGRFNMASNVSNDMRETQGMPYFAAAREIVTLANCDRSLVAIQTIVCLALYLRASGALSKVHAYVSAAASAALRLGLHEQVPCYPQDESALRQRTWSTIQSLDVYVSTSLGLPQTIPMLSGDAQGTFPPLSSGSNAELAAATAHAEVAGVLSRAINRTYRSSSARRPIGVGSFAVPNAGLQEATEELDAWFRNCLIMNQSEDNMTRSQLLLGYSYDYAQLLLYSPFVHRLTIPTLDKTSPEYTYATKCLGAAVHAVRTAELLYKRLQFNEAYFFAIDVLAFAAMVLLVVELGCPENSLVIEAMRSGRNAKEWLLVLSLHSPMAAECWSALAVQPAAAQCISTMRTDSVASTGSFHHSGSSAVITPASSPFIRNRPPMPTTRHDSAIDVGMSVLASSSRSNGPNMSSMRGFDPTLSVSNLLGCSWNSDQMSG